MADQRPSLAVVTPWYPGANNPFAGSFVQSAVEAVLPHVRDVLVVHAEDWPTPADRVSADLVRRAAAALTRGTPARVVSRPVRVREGRLLRVPAPVVPARDYASHARTHEAAVRAALPGGVLDADVVHGHVGTYGGWVAVRLARPGARVVVTEHATFLGRILRQRAARDMYDEVLERCDRFLCVSGVLRDELVTVFPHHAGKVSVLPNAVAVERIPVRPAPVTALRRWLYVGRLLEHKGVRRLLEAFAVAALDDPGLELTLLGGGRLRDELAARAAALGLADRVHLPGPVPHEDVVRHLHEHDLLVHLSQYETFGMTVVEAVASGMPVLVSRCGGPQETLAGIEDVAGTTVPVGDGVADVVAAYRELRDRLSRLDPARARDVMVRRYSQTAVGAALAETYTASGGDR